MADDDLTAAIGGAAIAAGTAAVLAHILGGARPGCVLTIRAAGPDGTAYLDENWTAYLGPFEAVSVKIANGADGDFQKAGPLIDAARNAGVDAWGWGYHYLSPYRRSGKTKPYATNVDSARAEGAAAGAAATRHGVSAYAINAEHYAFGVWGAPYPGEVMEAVAAFAETFHAQAPAVDLYWNGLSYMSHGAPTLLDQRLKDYCQALMPMYYSPWLRFDDAGRRRKKFESLIAGKAKAEWFGLPFGPMVCSGAYEDDKSCMWAADGPDGSPGLISTVAAVQPRWVCFFYGSRSKPILSTPQPPNPSLAELVPQLHAAYRSGGAAT